MEVPDCEFGENGLFVFADCAVNTDFDSNKLAEIAGLSAESFKMLVGAEPKVAMLSYSSMGSAKHDDVTKVADAVKIAHEKFPELKLDGELQLDAALVPSVGEAKAPGSTVAGHANTLVFPSLEAGNIGYKLVQRLAKLALMVRFSGSVHAGKRSVQRMLRRRYRRRSSYHSCTGSAGIINTNWNQMDGELAPRQRILNPFN